MSRDKAHLLDIMNACEQVTEFVTGVSFVDFQNDDRLPYAVMYVLTVAGEASRRLSETIRHETDDDVFRSAIALRNVIVHQYDGLNLTIIWDTANNSIPELYAKAAELLESLLTGQTDE